jgi:hypothetical protein
MVNHDKLVRISNYFKKSALLITIEMSNYVHSAVSQQAAKQVNATAHLVASRSSFGVA